MSVEYFIHDLVKVNHSITLALIGKIDDITLHHMTSLFPTCHSQNWDYSEVGDYAGFSESLCVSLPIYIREDSIKLNFEEFPEKDYFDSYIASLFPDMVENLESVFCEVVYANLHDDSNFAKSRGQLMYILENKDNHTLFSIDNTGLTRSIIPQAGDVIFLDICCGHALIPSINDHNGLENINYLKMFMVTIME